MARFEDQAKANVAPHIKAEEIHIDRAALA